MKSVYVDRKFELVFTNDKKNDRCFYCTSINHEKTDSKHPLKCRECKRFVCKLNSVIEVCCVNCQNYFENSE